MIRKGTLADVWMETSTGAAGTAEPGLEVPAQNSRARPEDKDLASVVSLSLSLSQRSARALTGLSQSAVDTCARRPAQESSQRHRSQHRTLTMT